MIFNKLIFFIFLFFSNLSHSDDNNQQLLIKHPKKIDPFSLIDMNDIEKKISNSDGKLLLLNFWATWCPPCIKEIPDLLELKKKFDNKLDVYFISVDMNVKKSVPKFLKQNNLSDLNFYNDEKLKLSKTFDVSIMPTTIIINKDFKEVSKIKGYVNWLDNDYIGLIEELL